MQSLNFETLNIGDIVLTNPKLKWHNIGNMGLFTDMHIVQSVDATKRAAVLSKAGSTSTNLLVATDGNQFTLTPMGTEDPQTIAEAFQMSHDEAVDMRLSERIVSEHLLGVHLESRHDSMLPLPVSEFIENFYKEAHSPEKGTNSYISDIATGYQMMRKLMDTVRDMCDKESAKEARLLSSIIEESRKAYAQIMELVQEANIEYTYSEDVALLNAQRPYSIPRAFRVGTSIMCEDKSYTISRVSATRAHVTDNTGEEVGYISSSKADGLKFTNKKSSTVDKLYREYGDYATYPASTPSEMDKLHDLTWKVIEIVEEHHRKMQSMIRNANCTRVSDYGRIANHNTYHVSTLSAAIGHVQDFVNAAQKLQGELTDSGEKFFFEAERLIRKAYGK
jgi:hypothetical protein